jgi:hypothetical protein
MDISAPDRSPPPSSAAQPRDDTGDSERSWAGGYSPLVLAVASGLVLLVVTLADVLISEQVVVLTVFLGLSPLLASSVLGPAATAGYAAAAVALAAVSGAWNEGQGAQ